MSDTFQVTFTVNRDIFAALRQDPEHFVNELRLVAAVKWYEMGYPNQTQRKLLAYRALSLSQNWHALWHILFKMATMK